MLSTVNMLRASYTPPVVGRINIAENTANTKLDTWPASAISAGPYSLNLTLLGSNGTGFAAKIGVCSSNVAIGNNNVVSGSIWSNGLKLTLPWL